MPRYRLRVDSSRDLAGALRVANDHLQALTHSQLLAALQVTDRLLATATAADQYATHTRLHVILQSGDEMTVTTDVDGWHRAVVAWTVAACVHGGSLNFHLDDVDGVVSEHGYDIEALCDPFN